MSQTKVGEQDSGHARYGRFSFDRYLNIRSASAPGWLATGRRVAFLTDITGTPQVWAVDAAGGWPDQLTFFPDKVWALAAAPAGDRLVCARDVGGDERYQLYLVGGDAGQVVRLTRDDGAMHHWGGWSPDGQRIAYTGNSRDGVHFDVYLQQTDGGPATLVWQSDGNSRVLAWSPDGDQLLLSDEVSSADQPLTLLDLASGATCRLTPGGEPAVHHSVRWARDGRVYLITDQGRDLAGPARLDLATGRAVYLADHPWEAESLALAPDGQSLAYTLNVDGYARLFLHDLATGQARPVTGLPDGVVAESAFSPDGAWLAVSLQSPRHNLNVWLVEVATMAAHQLTCSSMAGIPADSLVKPELIHYETFDGRQIPALFYRPLGGRPPLPTILYVHGGPTSQARPDFDPRFQFFLGQGYAVLAPNVRGSSGYGRAYLALDDVERRLDSVCDLEYAVRWLRDSGLADPGRIAIYGRSYGGYMTLAAITAYPDLWAAAIDVVGIANWVTFLENTGPWRRAHREREYGSLERDRAFLTRISPIHQVDRVRAPLLVIHGANDPRVPVSEADEIVARLEARGHPVEYLRYSDEGHKISKLANRIDSFTRMAQFLRRYL